MGNPAFQEAISVDTYLGEEEVSDVRHEYLGGRVYAMTGASRAHGLIALNMAAFLHSRARGSDCQIFVSDMKVRLRIAGDDVFYYPDLVMTCDPGDREPYYCSAPCLIAEVLSSNSERIDRREKFLAYTSMASLRAYLVVAQDARRVELFRSENGWHAEVFTDGVPPLTCLPVQLPLETIYEGLEAGTERS
ncbi:MAG: Uma2 family endonuclease [Thiohalocapsa sp.]